MISDVNQNPIKGLEVLIEKPYYALNQEVSVKLELERGSHVTYTIYRGDGSSVTVQNPEMLAFKNPVVIPHTYSNPGNYTIEVTASNQISTKSSTIMVIIQEMLSAINVQHNDIVAFPSGIANFELRTNSQFDMSQISATWLFGNSKIESEYIDRLGKDESYQKQHQYFINDIGLNQFTVIVSNAISSVTHNGSLVIQQKIKDLQVKFPNNLVLATNEILQLRVSTTKGTNLNFVVQFGDGNLFRYYADNYGNIKQGQMYSLNVSDSYDTPGYYFIYVEVFNNISMETYNHSEPVNVQQHVNHLIVETFGIVGTPGDAARFRIKYTGFADEYPTEVACKLYINNIYASTNFVESFKKTSYSDLEFTLTDIHHTGIIPALINCSNKLNHQVLNTSLEVQRKIDNVVVTASKVNIAVNDTVVFEILIRSGEDITMSINYGDGSNEDTISIPGLFNSNKVFQFIHTYNIPGFFIPTILIYNIVSKIIKHLETNVYEAITGVELKRYYKLSDISEDKSFGEGHNGNIFPKERDAIFESSYKTGNGLTFYWDFGDGTQISSKQNSTSHKYVQDGNFTISLNISNPIFSIRKWLLIEVYETVQMYLLENNGPKKALEVMTFKLYVGRPGTLSCYIWNMNDNTEPHVYGHRGCLQHTNDSTKYTEWNPPNSQETTLSHSHVYKAEGTFPVEITALNLISSATQEGTAVVAGINCHYPDVNIIGPGQNPDHPVKYFSSDRITFESNIVVNCPASKESTVSWTLQKVLPGESYQDVVLEDVSLDGITLNNFQVTSTK